MLLFRTYQMLITMVCGTIRWAIQQTCVKKHENTLVFYVRSPNRFCIIGKNHVKSSTTYQHHNTCVNIYNFFTFRKN